MFWYANNWLMLIVITDSGIHVRTDYLAYELYKVFSLITSNNALIIQLVSITFIEALGMCLTSSFLFYT